MSQWHCLENYPIPMYIIDTNVFLCHSLITFKKNSVYFLHIKLLIL